MDVVKKKKKRAPEEGDQDAAAVAEERVATPAEASSKKKKKKHAEGEEVGVGAVDADEEPNGKKKKKLKQNGHAESAEAPEVESQDSTKKEKKAKKNKNKSKPDVNEEEGAGGAVADATSDGKIDWKAKKKEMKEKFLANLDEEEKAKRQAKLDEKATREKLNEALKKKGKLTKKQKYLAAKAAKKGAQAEGPSSQNKNAASIEFKLEDALAAAQVTKIDPKATNCFLTGLPYAATDRHVADHFAGIDGPPCSVQLLRDGSNNRNNGTGFVTFTTAEQALHACLYTGSKIQGRWIKVRLCEQRDTGLGSSIRGPAEKPEGCLSAVVKCDPSITEASLKRFFSDCDVANVSRILDKETGEFRGTAFLDFEYTEAVDKAVKKNGQTIKGHPIMVRYKAEKKTAPTKDRPNQIAAHNRAPPVPPPSGKMKTFESESDDE